jgi:hypothetical protein
MLFVSLRNKRVVSRHNDLIWNLNNLSIKFNSSIELQFCTHVVLNLIPSFVQLSVCKYNVVFISSRSTPIMFLGTMVASYIFIHSFVSHILSLICFIEQEEVCHDNQGYENLLWLGLIRLRCICAARMGRTSGRFAPIYRRSRWLRSANSLPSVPHVTLGMISSRAHTSSFQPLLLQPILHSNTKQPLSHDSWILFSVRGWKLADPSADAAVSCGSLLSPSVLRSMIFLHYSYGHLIFWATIRSTSLMHSMVLRLCLLASR